MSKGERACGKCPNVQLGFLSHTNANDISFTLTNDIAHATVGIAARSNGSETSFSFAAKPRRTAPSLCSCKNKNKGSR